MAGPVTLEFREVARAGGPWRTTEWPGTINRVSNLLRFLHILSATVWIGGLITLGVLVGSLRRSGAHRDDLRAMARSFGGLWWIATVAAVVTGIWMLFDAGGIPTGDTAYAQRLFLKLALIGISMTLAVVHSMVARDASPGTRGALQGANLLIGVGVLAAAVWL